VKYIKEKIKDGVNLHLIINDNFKTDFTVVFLSVPLEKEYVTKNALLPAVIKDGSTSFPNYKKLTEELEMMYGASFDCGIDKNGDNLILKFYIETINDNYLPKENDNINKSIKILLDLICNPLIENNGFKKEYVDLEKKNLELLINAQKDDKNIYAFEKCINIMYKNSGYGLSKYGKIEDLEQITEHNLYEQYKKLLNEAKIDIFISGNFEQEKISNEVKENKFIKTLIPRQEQINTNHYKNEIKEKNYKIVNIGTTGSARKLIGTILNASIIKNEITAHAIGTTSIHKDAKTIFEIGGQDSKIILLEDGIVTDYAMNTICSAGTGSFLSSQARRLNIEVEDFGKIALTSKTPTKIAARCTVFAESDLVHKAQIGHKKEDIKPRLRFGGRF